MIVQNCTLIKPLSIELNENIVRAAQKLKENKQRRIIITDNQKPVGIISTTDINNKVVAENKDPISLKAKDVMNELYMVCDIKDDLSQIADKMNLKKSYFCPVVENDKLIGILTYGEVVKRTHSILKESINGN